MKNILTSASALFIGFVLLAACKDKKKDEGEKYIPYGMLDKDSNHSYTPEEYNNTRGYWENGQIITEFNCPDAVKSFPPIDLKSWYKIPAVNGRLPTYEETQNGTAIHHYGEKKNPNIRPYTMWLPKLAYRHNPATGKDELVVVIQVVQTKKDTIVGFRYITGGCGGSLFRDYRLLTDEEVNRVVG